MMTARVFLALVLLAGYVSAHAETFGRTTVGATASGAMRPEYKRGSKFTLTQDGTATRLCAWLDGGGAGPPTQSVRLAMYRDTNGVPGAKVVETGKQLIGLGDPARWRCFDMGWTPLTAGAYWLIIQSGGGSTTGPARYFYDGPANYIGNADAFADGASDPFGAATAGGGTMSIYAEYTPAAQLTHAGRMTIGSQPSGGLRSHYKRGSSLSIPTSGRLESLSAYLDGNTPANPNITSEEVELALYEDVNGLPGKLVAQSEKRDLERGTLGRWFTFPTPEATVHAGKYWLALHSGDEFGIGGVLRYFAEGMGNYLGNQDFFDDEGASDPFGPADPGNGTISAFASYQPGNLLNRFGYPTVGASVGGGGWSCNQASRFRLAASNATLDGLYAYLDGLGPDSGTQQVRMAIYYHETSVAGPLAQVSNVVTISSGRQPGWVKFDIPPTALPPGAYWLSVQTGPGRIVRMYQDDFGEQQYNCEDDFADGPNDTLRKADGYVNDVPETLSVYATYATQ